MEMHLYLQSAHYQSYNQSRALISIEEPAFQLPHHDQLQLSNAGKATRFGKLSESADIAKIFSSQYKTPTDVVLAILDHYHASGTDSVYFTLPGNGDYLIGLPRHGDLLRELRKIGMERPRILKLLSRIGVLKHTPIEEAYQNKRRLEIVKDYVGDSLFVAENPHPGFALGQSIARLKDIRIHPRIKGLCLDVPEKTDTATYAAYKEKIQLLAHLPKESYTDLARLIAQMASNDPPLYFDPGADSLILNPSTKRIHIIDPASPRDVSEFYCNGNNTAGLVAALVDSSWLNWQRDQKLTTTPIAATDPELQALRRQILKKTLIAAYEAGLSYEINPFPEAAEHHYSHDIRNAFWTAGLNVDDCQPVLNAFALDPEGFREVLDEVWEKEQSS